MPRLRNKENEGLPNRWQFTRNAFYYQVPPGQERFWKHKKKYRLGETYKEALDEFQRMNSIVHAEDIVDRNSLLNRDEILAASSSAPKHGVYFLIDGEEIVYVGRSDSVHVRIATHATDGRIAFDKTLVIAADGDVQCRLEQLYISMLKPKHNINMCGLAFE